MEVRPYVAADFAQINKWSNGKYTSDLFPETGFIVDGIAAYFLYKTDSRVCWLENMVSNPESTKEDRHKALTKIIHHLLIEAKRMGFRVAYATTSNSSLVSRAIMLGAKPELNQVLLQLAIH